MLSTIILPAAAFAGLSSAQSTTSLFVPGADTQPLVASIIGSDTLATTYAVECAPGTDSDNCGFPGGFTLTEGPSTAAYTVSMGYENGTSSVLAFTGYYDCSLAGTISAVCTESFGGEEANFPGMSTEILSSTDYTYMPVVITTGALVSNTGAVGATTSSGTQATETTKAATTPGKTGSSGTTTDSKSSSGTASGAAQTTSSKTSTSTAAAPAVTGKARWVVGGAAVALAMMG